MSEEKKQRLKEYQKNYREAKNSTYYIKHHYPLMINLTIKKTDLID